MNMLLFTFQASLLALIAFSFLLVVAVPVLFASPNGFNENKNFLLLGSAAWTILVLLVGTLNYQVI
uniref:photosystem II protein Z n=1 Tax=Euglena deses TaxID=66845 RepID=UPI0023AAF506|nr:photosystem II protein Z [Euglena deses]WCH63386.1 photosystem II protein Z [Euglena deses]